MMLEPLLIAAAGLVFIEFEICDIESYARATGRVMDRVTMSVGKFETFIMVDDTKHEGCVFLATPGHVVSVRGTVPDIMRRLEFQGFKVMLLKGGKDE